MIEFRNVTFGKTAARLFDGFNWRLDDPGRYLVLGPSGAGKSVLAGLMAGRLRPESGSIEVDGERVGNGQGISCFYAESTKGPVAEESVWEYLSVEIQAAAAGAGDLGRAWHLIEEYIPEGRDASVCEISHGQFLLIQIALAVTIPSRLCVLDGHLTWLGKRECTAVDHMLGQAPEAADRYFVFTSGRQAYFHPEFNRVFALTADIPRALSELETGEIWFEDNVDSESDVINLVYKENWIDFEKLVSGANFRLISRSDNLVRIKLTGSIDGTLEELEKSGLRPVRLEWET